MPRLLITHTTEYSHARPVGLVRPHDATQAFPVSGGLVGESRDTHGMLVGADVLPVQDATLAQAA